MKVLLLHLPDGGKHSGNCYRSESLGLGYVAAVLRRDGHEVEVFDASLRRLGLAETVREVSDREFDCLGITALQDTKDLLVGAARAIRRKKKSAIIIAGGYLPTLSSEALLRMCPELDFVVRGEGEQVASDVIGRIGRGEDWRETPGIAYLADGEFVSNTPPPLIQDLDSLPFPARDALRQVPASTDTGASIASSRGCYHKCSFCSINSFYHVSGNYTPRFRSPKNFADELESVVASTGVKRFQFLDDDFIGPGRKGQERAQMIAEEIRSRDLGVRFSIEFRADEVDVDTLRMLKEAGLMRVFLGLESGVQRQLDTYNKGATVDQNRKAVELVRSVGLVVHAGFIMYDPYTTVAEIQQNLQFIKEIGMLPDVPPVSEQRIQLYEGIPLLDTVRKDGLLRSNGLDLDYVFKHRETAMLWNVAKLFERAGKLAFWRRPGEGPPASE